MNMSELPLGFDTRLPTYSTEPFEGEERLYFNESRPSSLRTGTFFKQGSDGLSIVLKGQNDNTARPSFGRGALISGVIDVGNVEGLKSIHIKLQAMLETTCNGLGTDREDLLKESKTVWTDISDEGSSSSSPLGNSSFEFSLKLPMTSTRGGQLPPSLSFEDLTMAVKSQYFLSVVISRRRKRKVSLWATSGEKLVVEFDYVPRSRPAGSLGVGIEHEFLSSVKSQPSEWFQSYAEFSTAPKGSKTGSAQSSIHCDFFSPSSRIFSFADTIPFHIQLTGTSDALTDFLPPSYNASEQSQRLSLKGKFKQRTQSAPKIRVQIIRQVLVTYHDQKLFSNIVLGEGKLWQVFNDLGTSPSVGGSQRGESDSVDLHWDGYVKCDMGGTSKPPMGSFSIGKLTVKDFILAKVSSNESQVEAMNMPISIRLVTDPWIGPT